MKKIIGCTTGIFDMFHIGHLKILDRAKQKCDHLIVGVTTDEVAFKMKGKIPIIPFEERLEIVRNIKFVDEVIPKLEPGVSQILTSKKINIFFKGDDWQSTNKGIELEKICATHKVRVEYFPYTKDTSSTILRETIRKFNEAI